MIRRLAFVLLAAGLALAGAASAQEQAFANRATELKDRPAFEGRTIAPVPDGTPVKVLSRQGGWTEVQVGANKGYIRVFHLRFPSTVEQSSSGGGLTSLFGFGGSKRGPETSKVATIGIRGLTPEDFQSSSPDPAALRRLQSFRSDKATAERFAKEAKLAAVRVDYADAGGKGAR